MASPRLQLKRAPITSAATSTPCHADVIGMSNTAWAIIAGIRDRVPGEYHPEPDCGYEEAYDHTWLYTLGS